MYVMRLFKMLVGLLTEDKPDEAHPRFSEVIPEEWEHRDIFLEGYPGFNVGQPCPKCGGSPVPFGYEYQTCHCYDDVLSNFYGRPPYEAEERR